LNRAHLDYFYWLLAGLCVVELVAFFFFSRAYVYKKKGGDGEGNGDYRRGDADSALV
jgi:peptide/histidine transporter 3/4